MYRPNSYIKIVSNEAVSRQVVSLLNFHGYSVFSEASSYNYYGDEEETLRNIYVDVSNWQSFGEKTNALNNINQILKNEKMFSSLVHKIMFVSIFDFFRVKVDNGKDAILCEKANSADEAFGIAMRNFSNIFDESFCIIKYVFCDDICEFEKDRKTEDNTPIPTCVLGCYRAKF